RMPLIVARQDFDAWLDNASQPKVAMRVIAAGAETSWTSRSVGPLVNSVRNDSPECILPARHATEGQGRLF
ncbi:MAG: SOS response-associated peptidase, partial [Vicinamibacteria bacterium]|nr:SOS response-associated peptidase [Vicinamibacteria bacterium]